MFESPASMLPQMGNEEDVGSWVARTILRRRAWPRIRVVVASKDDFVSPSACSLATATARFQVVWAGVYIMLSEAQAVNVKSDCPVGIEAPIHTEEHWPSRGTGK